MASQPKKLTKSDLIKSFLTWQFFSHANYNYERLQATAFAQAMGPIIRKLYTAKEDISAALKRHLNFFNTEPNFGAVIHGITIAMEEEKANGAPIDDDAINAVKTGLMGPSRHWTPSPGTIIHSLSIESRACRQCIDLLFFPAGSLGIT